MGRDRARAVATLPTALDKSHHTVGGGEWWDLLGGTHGCLTWPGRRPGVKFEKFSRFPNSK